MLQIYTGDGRGKSPAALGSALLAASEGKEVVIIQFLKGNGFHSSSVWKKLEPQIKIFNFEKGKNNFCDLSEDEKEEAVINIKNGISFAKKVMSTGECDLVILDEVLGLVDEKIIDFEELKALMQCAPEYVDVIMTGIQLPEEILKYADEVSRIVKVSC